ncbi:hypothetical protein [Nocardia xishanensis]
MGQDDGDRPSVLCRDPLDEALGFEAIDEADCARVSQAQHGTQLGDRPAVEQLVQGGQRGGGRRAAALALTEAATRIQDGSPGVTDEIWEAAATHFDEKQMSAIILNIAITNFFNRINHTIREQAGKTW